MESSERSNLGRHRVIVLHKLNIQARIRVCFGVPGFTKETSRISEAFWLKYQHARQRGFTHIHNHTPILARPRV